MADDKTLVFADLRGGINATDPPMSLAANQVVDAVNVDYFRSTVAHKRNGMTAVDMTSGPTSCRGMGVYQTGQNPYESRLFVGDGGGSFFEYVQPGPFPGMEEWRTHPAGAITDDRYDMVTFNGKLFISCGAWPGSGAYTNVIRVWDGGYLRTAGLEAPTVAPTVTNTGAGAYAATIRYYKTMWWTATGAVFDKVSELSPVATFTPSGSGTAARIARPALINNHEEGWSVYASADGNTYVRIADLSVGTLYHDDVVAPGAYTGDQPYPVGDHLPPRGAVAIGIDGDRMVFYGYYPTVSTSTDYYPNWVAFTPVLGASDIGDDERVPVDHTLAVGENDGDYITAGTRYPVNGSLYAFKTRHIYKLTPTGNEAAPYAKTLVAANVGARFRSTVAIGQYANGDDAIYFMSNDGPYRYGANGLEYLGHNVEPLFSEFLDTSLVPAISIYINVIYYPRKRQVWYITNGYGIFVYHVETGGWTRYTADTSGDGCLFHDTENTWGDTLMPFVALNGGAICNADRGTTDNGTAFQAYIQTAVRAPFGLTDRCNPDDPIVTAPAESGSVLEVTAIGDHGAVESSALVSLTPSLTETRVVRKAQGATVGDVSVVQYQIGDVSASAQQWSIDAMVVPVSVAEPL